MKTKRTMLTKGGILLVEEDPGLRDRMVAALEAEHYDVFVAREGESAASIVDSSQVDILVVDLTTRGHYDQPSLLPARAT